jgi:hypothetical protein
MYGHLGALMQSMRAAVAEKVSTHDLNTLPLLIGASLLLT